MAEQNNGTGGNLPVAGLVALVLFVSGMWVQHQPLQSDRPGLEMKSAKEPGLHQDVEARLWQDPLEAVRRAQDKAQADVRDGPSAQRHDPAQLKGLIDESLKKAPVLVLPVLVFGGPYAEDSEDRRRTRYAVLSALQQQGYVPHYSRGIGYVRLPTERGAHSGDPLTVPFEQWNQDDTRSGTSVWSTIFVLWMTEESLGSQTPARNLSARLTPFLSASDRLAVRVIGPAGHAFARDVVKDGNRHDPLVPDFYAPRLSLSGEDLKHIRVGPSSEELANAMVGELINRNVVLPRRTGDTHCADHIAIVAEADTSYARDLEQQLGKRLAGCAGKVAPLVVHYFRGLDGKVAPDGKEEAVDKDKGRDKPSTDTTARQERAQGQGQFDYLLRLAADLRTHSDALDREHRRSHWLLSPWPDPHQRSIRAVIIVGSDVHDKLAILHALRERLPQTVFVTTDLDARLLQRDQLPWTRNLVVASGFDLNLSDPPLRLASFRDTYQTATFVATQRALTQPGHAAPPDAASPATVRLFEIGNRAPVALDPPAAGHDAQVLWWRTALHSLQFGLLLVPLGLVLSWCVRNLVVHRREHRRWLIASAAGTLIALGYTLMIQWVARLPGEEPVRWLDGISIWPTNLVRLAVALLAAAMLLRGVTRLQRELHRIEEDFSLPASPATGSHLAGTGNGWRRWLRCCLPCQGTGHQPQRDLDVQQLWGDYREWLRTSKVLARCLLALVLLFLLLGLALNLEPVIPPLRGRVSWWMDLGTMAISGVLALAVLVWTLDQVAFCSLFLRRLYGNQDQPMPSNWNQKACLAICGYDVVRQVQAKAPNDSNTIAAQSYIDLRLSARLTEAVGGIVVYPFVLGLLLMVAQSHLFDNWAVSRGLLVVAVVVGVLVTLGAMAMRMNAERIRHYTLDQLEGLLVRLRARQNATAAAPNPGDGTASKKQADETASTQTDGAVPAHGGTTAEQVSLMRDIARTMKDGAFAPFSSQPIVHALLLPFGGAGLVNLVDFLLI